MFGNEQLKHLGFTMSKCNILIFFQNTPCPHYLQLKLLAGFNLSLWIAARHPETLIFNKKTLAELVIWIKSSQMLPIS